MISYIGSIGFLLKEIFLAASESRAEYLGGMESILLARRIRWISPPDVIRGNPSVLEGGIGGFFGKTWRSKCRKCALQGDSSHREIELEQILEITHRVARFGIRDSPYVVEKDRPHP